MNKRYMFNNWSIKTQVYVPVIFGMLILSILLSIQYVGSIVTHQQSARANVSIRTIDFLVTALRHFVVNENSNSLDPVIDWLLEQPGIYSIRVSSVDHVLFSKISPDTIPAKYLSSYSRDITTQTTVDPGKNETSIVGHVEVVFSYLYNEKKETNEIKEAIIFVSILFLSVTSLALFFFKSVVNSVRYIVKNVSEMTVGDRSKIPVVNDNNELGILANCFNILVAKNQEYETSIVSANKLQEHYSSTLSHDLRSPLGVILSMLELTLNNTELDPHTRLHLTSSMGAGKQLLRLVDSVLDINKLHNGKEQLCLCVFDCKALFEQAIEIAKPMADQKGVNISTIFEQWPDELYVNGDSTKLLRMINNLISNAIKFTSQGTIDIFCSAIISNNQSDNNIAHVVFSIRDTGIGIPENYLDAIFEPFIQTDISKSFGGSGLGLAIVSEYSTLMNGSIEVESGVDFGSLFTLKVPFQIEVSKKPEQAHSSATTILCHGTRILLIDDNLDYQTIVGEQLKDQPVTLQIASNGKEGIALFNQNRFDVVLLDCQMPGMDGYQVANEIRCIENKISHNRTPIIALTADAIVDLRDKSVDSGMDHVLTKPFLREQLIELLKSCEK